MAINLFARSTRQTSQGCVNSKTGCAGKTLSRHQTMLCMLHYSFFALTTRRFGDCGDLGQRLNPDKTFQQENLPGLP